MERKKNETADQHYYSDRLKRELERLRKASSAIVEAPSGYGKTTAVRDFLEASVPQSAELYWFTAVDEAPADGFRRLCRQLEKLDLRTGERLLRIGFPNAATIGEACDALRAIECRCETWLVIDNFQFLNAGLPPSFLLALLEHESAGLHIVVVTQMLGRDIHAAIAGRGFPHITASHLRLDAGDIRRYYAQAGVSVTQKEAFGVQRCTEGWIIAVYLQLRAFQENGEFSNMTVLSLMEQLVWGGLTEGQKDFLLRCSLFETASVQQMCALIDCDEPPDYALDALQSPFIRYDPAERLYEPHGILFELLAQKRAERGTAFERGCLLRAGDLCRDEGRTAEALSFYWRIKDYGRMLTIDLSHMSLETVGNVPFSEMALDIAQFCPPELRRERPLSMLRIAWTLLTAGCREPFEALMEELPDLIAAQGSEPRLRGEWLLLSSFRHHPRLDEMTALLRQAAPLFDGECSRVIHPEDPWRFGDYYPLSDFHSALGEADREADAMERYIALYAKLTNGHGSGADALFRAELTYHRGDLSGAEIFAYKAAFLAENRRQGVIRMGAALLLAQVAMHRADITGWQHAVDSLERAISCPLRDSPFLRRLLEIVRGSLQAELENQGSIADWLKKGDFTGLPPAPAMSNALFVHLHYLLNEGRYAQLVGRLEAAFPEGVSAHPFRDMLWSLLLAVGYHKTGNSERAAMLVRRAVRAALPDGILFPLASFSFPLDGLPEKLIAQEYPQYLQSFCKIRERFAQGWSKLNHDIIPSELPGDLTLREREVALLAANGMRNGEIAKRLTVTENTVRAHMRVIFQKLDVDRRAKLAEKLK